MAQKKKQTTSKTTKRPHINKRIQRARKYRKISLETAAQELKVKQEHLEFFEKNEFLLKDLSFYQKGLLESYCRLLGINPKKLLDGQREQEIEPTEEKVALNRRTKLIRGLVASRSAVLAAGLLGLLVAVIAGSFLVYRLLAAPTLILNHPEEDAYVQETAIEFSGKTSAGTDVFINGNPVPVDLDGSFKETVLLSQGLNEIEVKAINSLSREAVITRTIVAEYPELEEVPIHQESSQPPQAD